MSYKSLPTAAFPEWFPCADPWLGPVRRSTIVVNDVKTQVTDAGTGRAVVLLHGTSVGVDARLTWFRLLPALARNARIIMFDQPGFGESAMPETGHLPDRLARSAHTAAMLDALGLDDVALIGHSEGGFVAAHRAVEQPARIRAIVVAASGATAPALGGDHDQPWIQAAARAYDYVGRTINEEIFLRTEMLSRTTQDAAFVELLRHNYRRDLASGHVAMFRRRAASSSGYARYTELQEQHLLPRLADLRVPCSLIWGGRDATVPVTRGEALARMIPKARFSVLPDAGHWLMHDSPSMFTALVEELLYD
jgi:pimeloyl-ACP methyl ester carboxylesterase